MRRNETGRKGGEEKSWEESQEEGFVRVVDKERYSRSQENQICSERRWKGEMKARLKETEGEKEERRRRRKRRRVEESVRCLAVSCSVPLARSPIIFGLLFNATCLCHHFFRIDLESTVLLVATSL